MLIVPDIQDVYTPLQMDLILPISEVCIGTNDSCLWLLAEQFFKYQ